MQCSPRIVRRLSAPSTRRVLSHRWGWITTSRVVEPSTSERVIAAARRAGQAATYII